MATFDLGSLAHQASPVGTTGLRGHWQSGGTHIGLGVASSDSEPQSAAAAALMLGLALRATSHHTAAQFQVFQ
jgi:hypothetical protein